MRIAPQLMTYADSWAATWRRSRVSSTARCRACSDGIHILPPFPSSGDRGFAPMTYDEIEPAFGSWADIERLATRRDVLLDVMINHVSRRSPGVRGLPPVRPTVALRRPVHHARQGLAGR